MSVLKTRENLSLESCFIGKHTLTTPLQVRLLVSYVLSIYVSKTKDLRQVF